MSKKRVIQTFVLLMLMLIGMSFVRPVRAEETFPEKSDSASWFDQYIEPLAFVFTSAGLGTVLGVCLVAAKVVKAVKTLKESKEGYDKDLGAARAKLEAVTHELEQQKTEFLGRIVELESKMHNAMVDCIKTVKAEVAGVKDEAHKSVEMALIAFGNDPQLVSNGHARRIAQIAEGKSDNENKV